MPQSAPISLINHQHYRSLFRIQCGASIGSAFVLTLGAEEFLITARHIVEGYLKFPIQVFREKEWYDLATRPIPNPHVACDVVALQVIGSRLSLGGSKLPRANQIIIGQDVFFLGFPLKLYTNGEADNNGYPLALVKKGICSGIFGDGLEQILYIDAMNTKGFSGGPLLCQTEDGELGVIAAISGYEHRVVKAPVGEGPQSARIEENVGITTAHLLFSALEGINEQNAEEEG